MNFLSQSFANWLLIRIGLSRRFGPLFIIFFITAVRAIARFRASQTCIETFTVLLLALRFFTVACAICMSVGWASLKFQLVFSHFDLLCMHLLIVAAVTSTFRCTHFTSWEALTVHFETVCLFACTANFRVFFLFWSWISLSLRWVLNEQPERILFVNGLILFELFIEAWEG